MQGEYTRESAKEMGDKIQKACRANFVLQELKKWIDYQLLEIEPSDWVNLSFVRKLITELEEDK